MNLIQIAPSDRLDEFLAEPALTIACVMLIVVSVGWVVISRLIVRNLRRQALRRRPLPRRVKEPARTAELEAVRPARDIWTMPP